MSMIFLLKSDYNAFRSNFVSKFSINNFLVVVLMSWASEIPIIRTTQKIMQMFKVIMIWWTFNDSLLLIISLQIKKLGSIGGYLEKKKFHFFCRRYKDVQIKFLKNPASYRLGRHNSNILKRDLWWKPFNQYCGEIEMLFWIFCDMELANLLT